MEWINVKNLLPKENDKFLVTDGKRVGTAYYDVSSFVGFDESLDCFSPTMIPTFWMPLPIPPQPERLSEKTSKEEAIV